ncbi:barstar family protein [Chitinophaga qingshengii]|uniref:Uncharacterized protein n=1 Tax=Chitinophaga qingshengii TaxID=1569794 RepID=A0ABR7TW19_9BACT|nr:hypothetical protein [Chitinophaga qingshengii]MBC9934686.1 hypothetical protein [Chitinophaga qingshengii]
MGYRLGKRLLSGSDKRVGISKIIYKSFIGMTSYIESNKEEQEYIAVLNGSACKTFLGFKKELVAAFSLPEEAADNINDISGYIFSNWLGFKRIKIVFNNTGSLKKEEKHFSEIMNLLSRWKNFWESLAPQNKLNIEVA